MDTLHFDGSCDPNPGGRLGFGWVLTLEGGEQQSGRGEQPPARGNTNNVGEYHGLLAGLQAYLERGLRGPLLVVGDSQLIIGQVGGTMRAREPALAQLRDRARALAARIPGGVTYQWVRRERNATADALAGDDSALATPPPAERSYAPGASAQTAPISAATRAAIVQLNAHPAPGFKDLARLSVGGADSLSALPLARLTIQAGAAAARQVVAAFPDDPQRQAAVLRWCLRGLAIELAIRKGQVDAQLAAQAGGRRR